MTAIAAWHPRRDDAGRRVRLVAPTAPTPLAAWADRHAIATVVPDGPMPDALNGVAFARWADAPRTESQWTSLGGRAPALVEPPLPAVAGLRPAAGATVVEPDARVWVVHPSNAHGGYAATVPKGKLEPGASDLQAVALREVFEETGLRIAIVGHLVDVVRTTTVARIYLARRVGGTPADMGWESQAVSLVPVGRLARVLAHPSDARVVAALGG